MNNYTALINQFFEIQQRLAQEPNAEVFTRNFQKISNLLREDGYIVTNPLGESFTEMRTDVEASVIGNAPKPKITKVIKPIIYLQEATGVTLVQKGIVIVE